jgi:hypothetical protein
MMAPAIACRGGRDSRNAVRNWGTNGRRASEVPLCERDRCDKAKGADGADAGDSRL